MIAMPAQHVLAREATVTGSIGVLLQSFDVSELMTRLGVRPDILATGPFKAQPNPFQPLTDQGRAEMMRVLEDLHGQFIAIVATGRSDIPNQVNNVLGFPFIFRGALDVRARQITENMKLAASTALADIARAGAVPHAVLEAYNLKSLTFGPDYIIPKPMDPRVLIEVTLAVAQAAVKDGVARQPISDWKAYRAKLESLSVAIAQRYA
jgi:hypothetical protein